MMRLKLRTPRFLSGNPIEQVCMGKTMILHKKSKSSQFESHQYHASSLIREKGKSQNGLFKKTKHAKFSEKRAFLTPDTHNFVFWKIQRAFLLKTPVLRFALLFYYRRYMLDRVVVNSGTSKSHANQCINFHSK